MREEKKIVWSVISKAIASIAISFAHQKTVICVELSDP